MRFNIICDIHWESKVDQTLASLDKFKYFEFFSERNYGEGLVGVTVLFLCQDPELGLKRRVTLYKKEKRLYMDIILDLPTMKAANSDERQRIIIEKMMVEINQAISKYRMDNFDSAKFFSDLNDFFISTGWI